MKYNAMRNSSAFTRIEMLVVIVCLLVVAILLLPSLRRAKLAAQSISCNGNLKEIGLGYRLWAGDHGGLVPSQQSGAKLGWADFLTNAYQGALCWTNYAIMQNELAQWPAIVICPTDERSPAKSFTNGFDNTNVSYFVGVSANDVYPQSIAGGDRNLAPGFVPGLGYGWSPSNGKGNDVTLAIAGPACWSLKMHSAGNAAGAANILLGDGSAQQVTSATFRQQWLSNAGGTTNWPVGHVPASPSIRLIFP
jgi:competence protein ComGC